MAERFEPKGYEVYADAGEGTEVVLMAEQFFAGIYRNIEDSADRAVIYETLHWAHPNYQFENAVVNYQKAMAVNERGTGIEAIILHNGEPAGLAAIDLSKLSASPEVNVWLGPKYHRQGIAGRALRAFMLTAKRDHPEILVFEYHILDRNVSSQRLVTSLGGSLRRIKGQQPGTPYKRSIAGGPEEDYYIWEIPAP